MPVLKKTRNGSTRYYVVTKEGGERRSHGAFATRKEAEVALSRLKVAKSEGRYRAPRGETVEAFLADWLDRKARTGAHRPRTSAFYRDVVRLYVSPVIGSMRLSDVRPPDVQAVVDAMRDGARSKGKAETVRRRYSILRAAFTDAVRTDRLAVSPCRGIELPKVAPARLVPPSAEEVGRILAAAVEPYRVPLVLAAWTGLRRGEVLGLRWRDVDLETGVAHVRQAASFTGREVTFDRPKSREAERAVPLAPEVVVALREARMTQTERRLKLGAAWVDLGLVVDNGDGRPMHPERLSRYFRELVKSLGLRVRLHDLRHAAVTFQLAAGVPLSIVAAVAGHASSAFTLRQYGHLQPEHLREAAEALSAAYGRP